MADWITEEKERKERELEAQKREASRIWALEAPQRERAVVNARLREEIYERVKAQVERVRSLGPETQIKVNEKYSTLYLSNEVKVGSFEPDTISAVLKFTPKEDGLELEFEKYFGYYRKSGKKRTNNEYYSYSKFTDDYILDLLKWVALKDGSLPSKSSGCSVVLAVIPILLALYIIVQTQ